MYYRKYRHVCYGPSTCFRMSMEYPYGLFTVTMLSVSKANLRSLDYPVTHMIISTLGLGGESEP